MTSPRKRTTYLEWVTIKTSMLHIRGWVCLPLQWGSTGEFNFSFFIPPLARSFNSTSFSIYCTSLLLFILSSLKSEMSFLMTEAFSLYFKRTNSFSSFRESRISMNTFSLLTICCLTIWMSSSNLEFSLRRWIW